MCMWSFIEYNHFEKKRNVFLYTSNNIKIIFFFCGAVVILAMQEQESQDSLSEQYLKFLFDFNDVEKNNFLTKNQLYNLFERLRKRERLPNPLSQDVFDSIYCLLDPQKMNKITWETFSKNFHTLFWARRHEYYKMTCNGLGNTPAINSMNVQVCIPENTKIQQIGTRDDVNEQSSVLPTSTVPDTKDIKKLPACLPMLRNQLSQVQEKKRLVTGSPTESEKLQDQSNKLLSEKKSDSVLYKHFTSQDIQSSISTHDGVRFNKKPGMLPPAQWKCRVCGHKLICPQCDLFPDPPRPLGKAAFHENSIMHYESSVKIRALENSLSDDTQLSMTALMPKSFAEPQIHPFNKKKIVQTSFLKLFKMMPLYTKNDEASDTEVSIEELSAHRKVPNVDITVVGLKNIDPKRFLKSCKSIQTSKTVEELLLKTSECQEAFNQTNCFQTVIPYVSYEKKKGIRIQWNVKEKVNNFSFGTSVNQKGHLSGDVTVEAACLLRRFHNACLNGNLTLDKNFELKATYSIPHQFYCPLGSIHNRIEVFNEKIRKNITSCYVESEAGLRLKWNTAKKSVLNNTLTLESVIRRLEFLPLGSSVPSVELSQVPKQSWKSSVQWVSFWNKQIFQKNIPYNVKIDTEAHVKTQLAYLHEPHFLFFKPEAHFGVLFQFLKSWNVSCTLAAGCLLNPLNWFPSSLVHMGSSRERSHLRKYRKPWSCSLSQIPLQDRFHMGGAYGGSSLSIFKGFAPQSIGPVSPRRHRLYVDKKPYWMRKPSLYGYDYLGGTVFSSFQIAVCRSLFTLKYKSLPSISPSGVAFLNAGVLGTSDNFYNFKQTLRSACGIGVSFPLTDTATLDVLLCKPLKKAETDVTNTFQMGLRVNNISFH